MKTVRLLPIVIFAAAALLFFKGIGLVTDGGYVLLGTNTVQAAGGGHEGGGGGEGEAAGEGGDGSATLTDHTMSDAAPTAEDSAPTMSLEEEAAGGGGHSAPAAGETPAEGEAAAAHGSEAEATADASSACPPAETGKEEATADAATEGHAADGAEAAPCDPALVTAEGDAVPMIMGPDGKLVPVGGNDSSQAAVLERLGERRTELDKREEELAMRMALVDAAEKRINERTALLEKLQGSIDSSVDQAKSEEEAQFKSVVAMYETMKPKEAAAIFNELDINTLLRVAVAMNPRKMAPIMAKMDPIKAKDLTTAMAVAPTEPAVAVTAEDIAALPQIVGQ